jgi:hypothetical protein
VSRLGGRVPEQRGFALATPVALVSAGAVVLAGIAFTLTGSEEPRTPVVAPRVQPTTPPSEPAPSKTAPKAVIKEKPERKKPQVRRGDTYVEVYNNSGISGLAGRTAKRARGAGWQVVGSDNWYGTIPTSTVYYPKRLEAEAKLLAKDLGIDRLKPAIAPMRMDRLTVILTGA